MTTDRIRVISGPWPGRIGCLGRIVEAPPGYDRYPWGRNLGPGEVVVLLDDDPLVLPKHRRTGDAHGGQAWTCCLRREHVETIDEQEAT